MSSKGDSAYPELLARIRQLEDETARLQLLIAELVLKNQHLRRDLRAPGVWGAPGPKVKTTGQESQGKEA
jgi:hypothetical protein